MGKIKILVVDDEVDILELVSKMLVRNGYEVKTASNLKDANACIRNTRWDLVVTDVMIPYTGGFDLVDTVKANYDIPVIVITGMSESVLVSTKNQADIIIKKPFSGAELLGHVNHLIKHS